MHKAIIIHGAMGSPAGNWFPWLANELRAAGVEVIVPQMPTREGHSLSNWMKVFERESGGIDSSTFVIGHSAGAVFLLRLLETISMPLGGSVFVAGFTGLLGLPEYDALNASFVSDSFKWDVIRSNAGKALCFSGDDDPYVPLEQGMEIARELRVDPIIVHGGGHLSAKFGFMTFPLLLEKIRAISGSR